MDYSSARVVWSICRRARHLDPDPGLGGAVRIGMAVVEIFDAAFDTVSLGVVLFFFDEEDGGGWGCRCPTPWSAFDGSGPTGGGSLVVGAVPLV